MKAYKNIFWVLLLALGFWACDDDADPIINSAAEDGTLTFQLNEPGYSNFTYVLKEANADLDMEELTCSQPDYGFTAAVTYTTEVAMSSDFSTFESLATTVTGEKVGVNTKEMNKALIALNDGAFSEPLPSLQVYIRLKAVISDATNNPVDNDTIVKPLYSNSISINIKPYIEPLYPYSEVTVTPWYIVGLGGNWENSTDGLGSSLIPLGVVSGDKYDAASGNGTFVYTGYFEASSGFKLIRDVGSYNPQWGMTDGEYTYNTGDNITVAADGYYTITLNSIDNKLTIEEATAPATTYASMGIIGAFNEWSEDVSMTANENTESHVWYTSYTFESNQEYKIRANGGWDVNWGTPSSSGGDAAYASVAIGKSGGSNILGVKGTYVIIFNDIDGYYWAINK